MLVDWHQSLSAKELDACIHILDDFLGTERIWDYRPTPKQRKFHALGRRKRNRLLRAGNQSGKTYGAAHEVAYHLIGEYPDWWTGKRFDHPVVVWVSGDTMEEVRDVGQAYLLGEGRQFGTGLIPKRCLTGIRGMARGVSNAVDFEMIRHSSGGLSQLKFKNYAQNRKVWQGKPVHVVWWDEEPPDDKHSEGMARTIHTRGITLMTFTPLQGMTEVVESYIKPKEGDVERGEVLMTLLDSYGFNPDDLPAEIARWPRHEVRARIYGEPMLGEGMVYPFAQEQIECRPFPIPDHWPVWGALDFGFDHPFAAVKFALNPDTGEIFICAAYREREKTPPEHWLTLRNWGRELVYAWPRDGLNREKGTGVQLIKSYRDEGMKVMRHHARYPEAERPSGAGTPIVGDGSWKGGGRRSQPAVSLEKGVNDVYGRLQQGTLKVFDTLTPWFEEQRLYHRKKQPDGTSKIVQIRDDLLDATRVGIMMLRYAKAPGQVRGRVRGAGYNWQAGA